MTSRLVLLSIRILLRLFTKGCLREVAQKSEDELELWQGGMLRMWLIALVMAKHGAQ